MNDEDNMFKDIITKIRSPFWFTLVLGAIGLVWPIWELGKTLIDFLSYVVIGFLLGLVLGFGVSMRERWLYVRSLQQQGAHFLYKTTSFPKYVLLLLAGLLVLLDSKGEIGYGIAVAIGTGVYLLCLSIVIFRIRNNTQILIT
jgi:hypothetical protein